MSSAGVKLLSHASILIQVDGKKILSDPWYFGTAFNDGWELLYQPDLEKIKSEIADVDIIWISHEHPDHLHFPTLKWIAQFVKKDVEIFFQKTNSAKVFEALKKNGYQNFRAMPHLERISISERVELACYAHRHLDSCLAVFSNNNFWLLNINDTELNKNDLRIIKRKLGSPSVIYNQFSIAGSNGIKSDLRSDAALVIKKMVAHHMGLRSVITVPFASFVNFARKDNEYMNQFANSVFDARKHFVKNDCELVLQAVGGNGIEWLDISKNPSNVVEVNQEGERYFSAPTARPKDNHRYLTVSKPELKEVVEYRIAAWRRVSIKGLFKYIALEPVHFKIGDWNDEIWAVDFVNGSFTPSKETDFDIETSSQPLFQAFKLPFGIQTLGVSGRYQFDSRYTKVPAKWKKIRILSSLYNAEIYLHPNTFMSLAFLGWVWERREGLVSQVWQQFRRFFSS